MAVTIGQLLGLNRLNEESEWENSRSSDEDEPSEIDEPRSEGYDFEFVNKLSSEHKCPICLLAMRNPVQTADCGHRFCEDCLLNAFRKRRSRVCPQDRNPIPKREGYFRDLAWERVILSLRVKCKQKRKGCKWTGELRQYKVHEGKDCAKFPLECPKKCGMNKIPREKVKSHVLQNCPMTMVGCVYKEAGCTFKVKRKDLAAHLKQATEYHLEKTWEELRKTKQKVELLEKKQKEQNRTIGMVKEWKKRMNGMQTRLDAMERNARDQKRACEVSFEKKRKMKRMCYSDDDDSD